MCAAAFCTHHAACAVAGCEFIKEGKLVTAYSLSYCTTWQYTSMNQETTFLHNFI